MAIRRSLSLTNTHWFASSKIKHSSAFFPKHTESGVGEGVGGVSTGLVIVISVSVVGMSFVSLLEAVSASFSSAMSWPISCPNTDQRTKQCGKSSTIIRFQIGLRSRRTPKKMNQDERTESGPLCKDKTVSGQHFGVAVVTNYLLNPGKFSPAYHSGVADCIVDLSGGLVLGSIRLGWGQFHLPHEKA